MRSVLADDERGAGRARGCRQRVARRFGRRTPACAPGRAGDPRARQRRVRACREPRDRRDACAADRSVERGHQTRTGRRRCTRANARRGRAHRGMRTAIEEPRRQRLPVGSKAAIRLRGRHARAARLVVADQSVHDPIPADRRRARRVAASSTGSRAPRCGCGAARSTRSAVGTSAISCTSKTSISAGGCAVRAGRSPTSRPASSTTCKARARPGRRTGCWPSTTVPRGASPGAGSRARVCSCCRSRPCTWAARGVLAMAAHAWRARRIEGSTG